MGVGRCMINREAIAPLSRWWPCVPGAGFASCHPLLAAQRVPRGFCARGSSPARLLHPFMRPLCTFKALPDDEWSIEFGSRPVSEQPFCMASCSCFLEPSKQWPDLSSSAWAQLCGRARASNHCCAIGLYRPASQPASCCM